MDAQGAGNLVNRLDIQDDLPVFILGEGGFVLADDVCKLVQGHVAGLAKIADAVADLPADLSHGASSCFFKINFLLFLFPVLRFLFYYNPFRRKSLL